MSVLAVAPTHAAAPTTLSAVPVMGLTVYEEDTLLNWTCCGPGARLTDADGAPVAGRLITFTAGGTDLCSAVTAPSGWAYCGPLWTGGAPAGFAALIVAQGYQASFAGDPDYAPAQSSAPLI